MKKLFKGQTKAGIGVVGSVLLWKYLLDVIFNLSPAAKENALITQALLAFVIGYVVYPKIVVFLTMIEEKF